MVGIVGRLRLSVLARHPPRMCGGDAGELATRPPLPAHRNFVLNVSARTLERIRLALCTCVADWCGVKRYDTHRR
jgi:hypothetical protein